MQVLLCRSVCDEFVINLVTDVRAVECINPKDLATAGGSGLAQASGLHYLNLLRGTTCEDLGGEVLGKVVSATGILTSQVGDMVLTHDGLSVECD